MKKYLVILAFLCTSVAALAQSAPIKQKLAVYMVGEIDQTYKKVIGSKMVTEITKSPDYSAVERTEDFLSAIVSEQDYQTSGNVSDNQIAKIGQQFGVRYVAVIDANELLDEIFVSSRLIDVQTGLIVYSFDKSSPVENMQQLNILAADIANGLIINPKKEERARAEAEKRRIEQEKAQKLEAERLAKERAEQEARNRMEQQRRQLREQAISNLKSRLGISTFELGPYLIQSKSYPLSYDYDPAARRVVQITPIPSGWRMADALVMRAIAESRRFTLDVPGVYLVVEDMIPRPDRRNKFNDSKKLGGWKITALSGNSLLPVDKSVGTTEKQKGSSEPAFHKSGSDFYTFLYRPTFSEQEIEAEIARISNR